MRYIVCFSGGHSSAIAAVETVRRYGKENVILLNHDICERSEDQDIKRFKKEVADYLNLPITPANMNGWESKDQFDVCMEENAFKYGIQSSAICTQKLKTEPFKVWLSTYYPVEKGKIRDDMVIIYGFDKSETTRITRRVGVMASMGYKTDYPALWEGRTINQIEEIGIKRPSTYEIFNHANCKGCLKAGKQHWFTVFCLYPEIWEKAKRAERERLGIASCEKVSSKNLSRIGRYFVLKTSRQQKKSRPNAFGVKHERLSPMMTVSLASVRFREGSQ